MNFDDVIELHKRGKVSDVTMGYCLSRALYSPVWSVRELAIQHPNATVAHIDKALRDGNLGVRMSAIEHPNVAAAHIDKAKKDGSGIIRQSALLVKKERNL